MSDAIRQRADALAEAEKELAAAECEVGNALIQLDAAHRRLWKARRAKRLAAKAMKRVAYGPLLERPLWWFLPMRKEP